jgi:predicted transcriptional regulator
LSHETKPLTALTAKIVGAYISSNTLSPGDLVTLIDTVHNALAKVGEPEAPAVVEETTKATPAEIRKSITPDALISFIDGKPFKMLRGHLATHGLTIAAYKRRYGLPDSYPTTAPSYSARRSAMAKEIGLGRRGRTLVAPVDAVAEVEVAAPAETLTRIEEAAPAETVAEVEVAASAKRGRRKNVATDQS